MARHPLPRRRRHAATGTATTRRSGGRRARKLVGVATVAGLVGVGTAVGAAVTSGTDAGSASFTVTDDAYVSSARPDWNSGSVDKLVASSKPGDSKITYLRFEVAPGTKVGSAVLTLQRTNHHLPPVMRVYATDAAGWSESTLTMRSAPKLGAMLDSIATKPTGFDFSVDVSAAVKGPGAYAFALVSPVADDLAQFRSKETGNGGAAVLTVSTQPTEAPPTGPIGGPVQPAPSTIPPIGKPAPPTTPAPTSTSSAPAPAPGPGQGCSVSKILVPSCGAWFGVAPHALTTEARRPALASFEATVGDKVDVMHVYHTDGQLFPTSDELAMARDPNHRRLLFVNWKPSTSRSWAQVAAGDPTVDAQIDKLAAHLKSTFTERFFLAVYHEPENDVNTAAGSGHTASDYRAMYRHVVQRLRNDGVQNAVTVMVYMGAPKWGAQAWFDSLYPGDDVVDWLGYDPYASAQPGAHGGDVADMVNRRAPNLYANWPGFYAWAEREVPGKPIALGEWGIAEWSGAPNGKADFLRSVPTNIAKFPRIKAMLYFDSAKAHVGDTRPDSSAASLAGFKTMLRSAYFAQTVPSS
jgi:glycosyl hydrolase family 26